MKYLCKYKGGSHSYGLNTPDSDIDWRGVFYNDDIATVIGLNKFEHLVHKEPDEVYFEVRHFLNLLKKGNTSAVEMLFNTKWELIAPLFEHIINCREYLIDSKQLFKSLRGYLQSERRLALGERKDQIGHKRYEQVLKYGFSPKNIVQFIRLAYAGCAYFKTGVFPVNVMEHSERLGKELLDIKTNPQKFALLKVGELLDDWEKNLVIAYENRTLTTQFEDKVANYILLAVYRPVINTFSYK